ncbi:hypothetical protein WG66_009441, partial [Moniliophthora roreri]
MPNDPKPTNFPRESSPLSNASALTGWHARALSNPHPSPDSIMLTRDHIDIISTSSSIDQ